MGGFIIGLFLNLVCEKKMEYTRSDSFSIDSYHHCIGVV